MLYSNGECINIKVKGCFVVKEKMKIKKKIEAVPPRAVYGKKKSIFSPKEIIFRGEGRAVVFKISSFMQMSTLVLLVAIGCWNLYSYYIYHQSDSIISTKEQQLGATRNAYVDLMTEFTALNKSISSIVAELKEVKNPDEKLIKRYRNQAEIIENKVNKITSENKWLSPETVSRRTDFYEAMLERDIAVSERDALKKQLAELESSVEEMRRLEDDVFEKIKTLSAKEVDKMKKALSAVNRPLREKGLYFNALANKKGSSGGPYIPENGLLNRNKELSEKISAIYRNMEDHDYYRQVVANTPIGKPVWSYWVTSPFGSRLDPFKKSRATHKGIDLASMKGNKIKVKARGKVTRSEYASGYGNLIVVDHGNGFVTKYGHLDKRYVKKGDEVSYDDVLGEVGSTGRSTGPHLHYEILYRGVPVNPLPFLQTRL